MSQIRWLGHAAVEILISGKRVIIDPLIKDNPLSPVKLNYLEGVSVVGVTHDHYDHLGDAVEILKMNSNAKLFATFDLEMYLVNQFKVPEAQLIPANVGGYVEHEGIRLALTKAVHSSEHSDPTGIVVSDGRTTIYHAGDTGLFEDMKLIGQVFQPDYALLPIGGRFTMDPRQAVIAVDMIKPRKAAIPIHFNTWDMIRVDPQEFVKGVKDKGYEAILLQPGQSIEL
ncbi:MULTISPECIES: metal-dependent hydrolase [Metallosphaera]|uniref:metal-dependent hydrolase n=1 Tax=Metallosphaera TaxID=41980 RepID=UPI001F05247C|nr:metal-dependent hydrolase [Metallosphaera sedula]MCH1770600.1 metal-dependent hydrolase [Metallosphaera sedula]MCP6728798.1 metal-dependent hydrolase [Metallosphaera sedula]